MKYFVVRNVSLDSDTKETEKNINPTMVSLSNSSKKAFSVANIANNYENQDNR